MLEPSEASFTLRAQMASARSGCAAPIVHAGASKRARAVACSRRSIEATTLPRGALSSTCDESDGAQQKHLGWMFDASADSVFSFQNVCDVLGIDGEALRARVRERSSDKRAA
jgi:hypothetical protein